MEIKKSTLYIGMILLILIVGGFFFFRGGSSTVNGNVVSEGDQPLQKQTQKQIINNKNI